jgi:exosome complex component RRP42
LLSLTTYLALLSTRFPRLKSEKDEDPLFDDDWDASVFLYTRDTAANQQSRPPVTLLVMAVGDNIIFDPNKEELSVADVVLAVSVAEDVQSTTGQDEEAMDVDSSSARKLRLLSVRMVDPPSRLTPPGVPNFLNSAAGGSATASADQSVAQIENMETEGVWQAPRGGAKRKVISAMIAKVLEKGGVAEEVLDGLDAVDIG